MRKAWALILLTAGTHAGYLLHTSKGYQAFAAGIVLAVVCHNVTKLMEQDNG